MYIIRIQKISLIYLIKLYIINYLFKFQEYLGLYAQKCKLDLYLQLKHFLLSFF